MSHRESRYDRGSRRTGGFRTRSAAPGFEPGLWSLLLWIQLFLCAFSAMGQDEVSLCADVQMEIRQQVSLERQAFDAEMKINNALPTVSLTDVEIIVTFEDEEGTVVTATSNPLDTNATFFITVSRMDNINAVDGTGVVAADSSVSINWLIIPVPGAGGISPQGERYKVGAEFRYTLAGDAQDMLVAPDTILVRPMPMLDLDYFLPIQVTGDDAFTAEIEPPVPFSLGVRVANGGFGTAASLKIDSGQPTIIENEQGLLVEFVILGSEVNGKAATDSLLAEFGDIDPMTAGVARWIMQSSLSGEFVEFSGEYSHSDAFGGELTSLIDEVDTHRLIHDVIVDLNGRDGIRDFLADDGGTVVVYETDNIDTLVSVVSAGSTLELMGTIGTESTYEMTVPLTSGPLYVRLAFGNSDNAGILSVIRSDGKRLPAANSWFSRTRDPATDPWEHWIDLFDVNGGGVYTIVVEDDSSAAAPPVIAFIGDKSTTIDNPLGVGFQVEASDPNGTVPLLTSTPLPPGASWNVLTNGLNAQGVFFWLPGAGQEGIHPVRFTASDGSLSDEERIRIFVGPTGDDLDTNGIPESIAGRSVLISNLVASSDQPSSEVTWRAAPEIVYDIYMSDDPFADGMAWTLMSSNVVAVSNLEAYVDGSLGTNTMRRFYQVVLSGEAPFDRGAWGVVRRDLAPGSYEFVAPPLRMDRRFNGELGSALASRLSGSGRGPGDGIGDEVYALENDGSWRSLYLDDAGSWREETSALSTFELPEGAGMIVLRNENSPARLTFAGEVGNDGTRQLSIRPGWNLLQISEGRDLPLLQAFAGAAPVGALLESEADQVILWDENGAGHWLMYAEGWGAPFDGNWIDLSDFSISNLTVKPGLPVYYLRRTEGGEAILNY